MRLRIIVAIAAIACILFLVGFFSEQPQRFWDLYAAAARLLSELRHFLSLHPVTATVLVCGVAAAVFFAFYLGIPPRFRLIHRVRSAVQVSIADAADGMFAKLVGRLRASEEPLLEAPVSGTKCVFYAVELFRGSRRRLVGYQRRGQSHASLDDGTGRVVLDLSRVVVLQKHCQTYGPPLSQRRLHEILARVDLQSGIEENWSGTMMSCRETLLVPEQELAAVGYVRIHPSLDRPTESGTYRTPPQTRRLEAARRSVLVVSGEPRPVWSSTAVPE